MFDADSWVTPYLKEIFAPLDGGDIVVKASSYSLFAGGKRMRPALMKASAQMLSDYMKHDDDVGHYAACLEMIHTYSLIHDDLPSMDNDDLRRGKPTCHIVYGEAFAVLAGDMLLSLASEKLIELCSVSALHAKASLNLMRLSGITGMIGGQSIDIAAQDRHIPLDLLYELQRKKTGALIEASVTTPWYLSDAPQEYLDTLKDYAEHLGLSFQIKDDILDVTADEEKLGKSTGKDLRDKKSTFVTLLGLKEAYNKLNEEEEKCYKDLNYFKSLGLDCSLLTELTDFNLKRDF